MPTAMAVAWLLLNHRFHQHLPSASLLLCTACSSLIPREVSLRVYQNIKSLMPPEFGLDASTEIDILCHVLRHGKAQRRLVIHCRRKGTARHRCRCLFPSQTTQQWHCWPHRGLGPQGRAEHSRAGHGWVLPAPTVRNVVYSHIPRHPQGRAPQGLQVQA